MKLPIIEVALHQAGLATEFLSQHHHLQIHHCHPSSPHQGLQDLFIDYYTIHCNPIFQRITQSGSLMLKVEMELHFDEHNSVKYFHK